MSRDWKPGDVARIELGNGVTHDVALRLPLHEGGWATGRSEYVHSVHVTNARRLVVIDPEQIPHLSDFDEDAARALSRIADDVAEIADGGLDATEEIIRWLADQMPKPPKPDEPQGLGAVVEDAEGARWTRYDPRADETFRWISEKGTEEPWPDIAAIRILSGGVA